MVQVDVAEVVHVRGVVVSELGGEGVPYGGTTGGLGHPVKGAGGENCVDDVYVNAATPPSAVLGIQHGLTNTSLVMV